MSDAYIEIFNRSIEYLDGRPIPFRPWVLRIVSDHIKRIHRKFLDTAKRNMQREQLALGSPQDSNLQADLASLADSITSPSSRAARKEIQLLIKERVVQVLAKLDTKDLEVYELRYEQNWTNKECADYLSLSEAAAGMRYVRLNRRLGTLLKDLEGMANG